MATYHVETDKGTFEVETDESHLPEMSGKDASAYWTKQGDNPAPGAEKPFEQRLAENAVTAGSGAMTPSGVMGLAGLGKDAIGVAGKVLNKVPATENMIPTIQRMADSQIVKSIGGTPGQIAQLGKQMGVENALSDTAGIARKAGLEDVFSTDIGRSKNAEKFIEDRGREIGELRESAGKPTEDIASKIIDHPDLVKYFGKGSYSKELGGVDEALADIAEEGGTSPTHKSLADAATFINKAASKAPMAQAKNAQTDVANILSRLNNEEIVQKLGSDKGLDYLNALKDESGAFHLKPLMAKGFVRENLGRSVEPAFSLGKAWEGIKDAAGYRVGSKVLNNTASALNAPTAIGAHAGQAANLTPASIAEWLSRQEKAPQSEQVQDVSPEIKDWLSKQH